MTTMTSMQYVTFFLALLGIARIAQLAARGRAKGWHIAPGIVLVEIVAFYIVVLFFGGFGSFMNATISATIRIQGVSLFVLYLFAERRLKWTG